MKIRTNRTFMQKNMYMKGIELLKCSESFEEVEAALLIS